MSLQVLIVDDSLTVRKDLEAGFAAAGFAPRLCSSLAEARAALAAAVPALVVLDLLLPDGDGIALLREMRTAADTARTPVIMLTSEAEVRHRLLGLRIGADEYVGKPYDASYVVGRAHQLIGRPPGPASRPRLLVVDDSASVRAALRQCFEEAGYAVHAAESGEDGLRAAVAVRPAALVVDGQLNGAMDGAGMIRRIKQDVALRHIPCLLLTASPARADELRALEAGADAYVQKQADARILLARVAAALRSAAPPVEGAQAGLWGPKRVLVTDDSPTFRHALAAALREEGYDAVLATCGEEALDMLQAQPVDAILMDVMMPGLSGHDTCRRIKANPSWQEIPLLMLTALDERQAMLDGIEAGADDYIPKSPDFDVLKARLRAQMRRRQYENENRRIRRELLARELEAAEARTAQRVAETRAALTGELERKNRELETFSYSVSHDLRAPLRAIRGFSQLLLAELHDQAPPMMRDYLGRIAAATERMGQLIDDLLALSRITRHELVRQRVDVSRMAREVGEQLARQEPHREVDFAVADGLEADADARLLRVVFENLLGNAWKFTSRTPQPRIAVGADAPERLAAAARAGPVFFVRDNGAGFDSTHADRLFGPFQRLHAASEFPGTGIGLATVYRIVDRHSGRIWAESVVGSGATFFFTLNAAAMEAGIA